MRESLIIELQRQGGVIRRDEALTLFSTHVVDDAVRAGAIVVAHPGVYRLAEATDLTTRRRAALAYCPDGALSHVDALELWGLPTASSPRVHVTVTGDNNAARSRGVQLHRRRRFAPTPPFIAERRGLQVVRLEQAIIDSWRFLPLLDRRAPAIVAVRDRRTTAQRLLAIHDEQPNVAGAREQRKLFAQLAAGNHSELEIWGHERVFSDRRLPRSGTQYRVNIGRRVFYLDRAFEAEMLDVELDGAAYHGSPGQRERDLRRDSALASLGWQTVRFSHPRLHTDAGGVIDELLTILTTRRQQLRMPA
jgi:very-short-patch-repair endonuclease